MNLKPACLFALPLSDETRERLKSEIHFDPNLVRDEETFPFELDGEVIELPALTVTKSIRRRDLEQAIERSQRDAEDRRYSFVRGGAIYSMEFKHGKLELGTRSVAGGIGFLKLSW